MYLSPLVGTATCHVVYHILGIWSIDEAHRQSRGRLMSPCKVKVLIFRLSHSVQPCRSQKARRDPCYSARRVVAKNKFLAVKWIEDLDTDPTDYFRGRSPPDPDMLDDNDKMSHALEGKVQRTGDERLRYLLS